MGKSDAKKRFLRGLCLCVAALSILLGTYPKAFAFDALTPINDLINKSAEYDGKLVHIKGEALLEALEQRDGSWVNINDGTNAIGVFMTPEMAKRIQYFGDYHTTGDTVELIGEFHRACKTHGGDLEVHLTQLVDLQPGKPVDHIIDYTKVFIALVLVTLGAALGWYYRKNR